MTLGDLNAIGPVPVIYRDPKLSWTSTPTGHGIRSCSITGLIELAKAQELSELVNNPAAQVTIGPATGVLEWIDMDGDVVGPFEGWYLLESFELSVEHQYSFNGPTGPTPFSLTCTYLGAALP